MTDILMEEAKGRLRLDALSRRAGMDAGRRAEAAMQVARHFFGIIPLQPGEVVGGYWPLRDELDCLPILSRLVDDGRGAALPVVVEEHQPLVFRRWMAGATLFPSGFGTLAPGDDAPLVTPQVVLVPLLGFDAHGTRLGFGGGYYDRTLAALPRPLRVIGLGYDAQRFDALPRAGHDVPLDAVITESGVTFFEAETQ